MNMRQGKMTDRIKMNKEKIFEYFYRYGLYVVFVLLIIVFSRFNKNFFSSANLINLLKQATTVCVAAAGLAFVMLTGGIDLSIGSLIFMTSVVVTGLTDAGVGLFGALLASMLCGALVGAFNGFLIAKLNMTPMIVTLAMMFVLRGLTIALVGIRTVFFKNDVALFLVRTRYFDAIPLIVVIMAIVLAICQTVLSKTTFGRQLFAIGNNKHGAQMIGIKVTRNIFLTYVICGALVGLSGLLSGAQIGGIPPTFAQGQEFIIISATVLGGVSLFGGKGSAFPGAFLGVLVIMTIENGLVMAQANMYAYTVVRGIIIFVAVFLDSAQNKGEIR
jgi:ribose/xylose/arabinose/galactoside ABC-type transport system permease subunit